MTCDKQNLYVLFVCNESKLAALRANVKERDGPVYNDDCVELFIDRIGDEQQYVHIVVNALGTVYDSRKDLGVEWNAPLKVAVSRQADSWTAELSIPFETFGGFQNTDRFGEVEFK